MLSPDGTRIALVANGALCIMAEDGTEPEALTGPGRYAAPAFSPDGSQIAYVAFDEAGLGELYGIDLDGRRTKRLTKNGVQDLDPVFAAGAPAEPTGRPAGKRPRRPPAPRNGGPLLVFSRPDKDGNLELFVMGADGGKARQLTHTGPAVSNIEPAASPDGSRIAYLSRTGGRTELWIINADGTEHRRLVRNGQVAGAPVFSPSGTKVYYLTERTKGEAAAAPFRVVNADGSWDRPLTREASTAILRYLAVLGFLGLMVTGPLLAAPANAAMIYVTSRVGEGEARIRDFFLGFGRFFARSAAVYAAFLLVAAILVVNLVAAAQMRIWLGKISPGPLGIRSFAAPAPVDPFLPPDRAAAEQHLEGLAESASPDLGQRTVDPRFCPILRDSLGHLRVYLFYPVPVLSGRAQPGEYPVVYRPVGQV